MVAARLSDADPGLSILVIEAGPDNRGEPTITHPGLFFSNFPPGRFNRFHLAQPSKTLNGRSLPTAVGRVLGGGTSVNTLMYTRGQGSDYDEWQTPGWSTSDLLPYFKKVRFPW